MEARSDTSLAMDGVDATEVGHALAAKMPPQTTENPLRDASAAYWRGRRAELSVQGSGAV